MPFLHWRDFNACGAHVYDSYMTRRAVLPKSNTGTGDVLATSSDVKFSTFLLPPSGRVTVFEPSAVHGTRWCTQN